MNGKAQPVIYFGPDKVLFESTPQLLGVTLDCQLTFGPHIDVLKKSRWTARSTTMPLGSILGPEPVITQISLLHLRTVLLFVLCIILAGIHRRQSSPQT